MPHISRLLDNHQREFRDALTALHRTVDGVSHDVNLLAEIAEKSARLKAHLRLDPADTTATELYGALRKVVIDDNQRLGSSLGIIHPNAVSEATPILIETLRKLHKDTQCYVPKTSVIKAVLKDNPPKTVMRTLHYRSVDSMLKHEQATHLIVLARYIEDPKWLLSYIDALSNLSSHDFEIRALEIVWLDRLVLAEALAKSKNKHHYVLHAKEAGCVAIGATNEKVIQAYTIRTYALATHYIQELLYATSYAKSIIARADFGKEYTNHLLSTRPANLKISSHELPWRALHKAVNCSQIHDVFPPHIAKEDWIVHHANDRFQHHSQQIGTWNENAYLVTLDPSHVSANVIDVAIDASYDRKFGEHSLKFGRRELEQELFRRYLHEPRIQNVILKRIGIL